LSIECVDALSVVCGAIASAKQGLGVMDCER
jgi:hypothetical protein